MIEILFISIGLSMDAFAVAMGKGLCMKRIQIGSAVVIALFFGVFQAVMPVLGWLLASRFYDQIAFIDHWLAFGLLALIGIKMIYEAFQKNTQETEPCDLKLDYKELFIMAIATSIDALAAGLTLTFLEIPIITAVSVIGLTTFVLSLTGVVIGQMFGTKFSSRAECFGGGVLIIIGIKILVEHLGLLN